MTSCEEKEMQGSYDVIEIAGKNVEGKGVTINITQEDGTYRIGGNNGCNTYGADIEYDGSRNIKIGMAMATKMYCKDTADIEQSFMDQLSKTASYRISNGDLLLLNESGDALIKAQRKEEQE
jgi:heat shock protein HslJ